MKVKSSVWALKMTYELYGAYLCHNLKQRTSLAKS